MDTLLEEDLKKTQWHVKDGLHYISVSLTWYAKGMADKVTNCIMTQLGANNSFCMRHSQARQELQSAH